MQPATKIFLIGVPGVGKTTLSRLLQKQLGYPLVEADALRDAAQKEKSEEEDVFLYMGTTEAYRRFGALTKEHAVQGLQAVRKSMRPYVESEIGCYPGHLIMEGAFLDPAELVHYGTVLLVVVNDEEQHKVQYFLHRPDNQGQRACFQAARILQAYFLQEARVYSMRIIENSH
jgi:2-phosphoglycerate kinase